MGYFFAVLEAPVEWWIFLSFPCSRLVLHKRLLCRATSIHGGGAISQPLGLQIKRPAADFLGEDSDVCALFFSSFRGGTGGLNRPQISLFRTQTSDQALISLLLLRVYLLHLYVGIAWSRPQRL